MRKRRYIYMYVLTTITHFGYSWHLDPSGTYTMYNAKAIGSGNEGAQSSLLEVYHKGITMAEAEEKLLIILKQVMEEKLNSTNVEVCV